MEHNIAKRAAIGFLASLSLLWALWSLALATRGFLAETFRIHRIGSWLGLATGIVLIWLALRGFRIALGKVALNGPRFKPWRLFASFILFESLIKDVIDP